MGWLKRTYEHLRTLLEFQHIYLKVHRQMTKAGSEFVNHFISKWEMSFSVFLRGVRWFETHVLGVSVGPIFNGQNDQELDRYCCLVAGITFIFGL